MTITGIMAAGLTVLADANLIGNIGIIAARMSEGEPLKIMSVLPGTPAERAGVMTNWFVISVNGTNVVSESFWRCFCMWSGPVGSPVIVELADPNTNHTNRYTMERANITMPQDAIEELLRDMFRTNAPVISQQGIPLTPEQAKTLALRLANDAAATLFNGQPFQDGQSARLIGGRWVWTDIRGFGHADIQATVELAVDGSTNHVDLQILVNENPVFPGGGGRRGGF